MSLRNKKKTQTRATILEATKRLIETEEFDVITTRLIAETAEISYQTLYNYFPTKTDILTELLKKHLVGSEETYQQIVRTFSGELIRSLEELNRSRFNFVLSNSEGANEYLDTLTKVFFGTKLNERLSLIESLDQSGAEQYQAILALTKGMGLLREDTDIQLMAHTLWIISAYAVRNFLISETEPNGSIFLESLNLQTTQLVKPYLLEKTG
jgi:AcrR family transcriptional regulator